MLNSLKGSKEDKQTVSDYHIAVEAIQRIIETNSQPVKVDLDDPNFALKAAYNQGVDHSNRLLKTIIRNISK